MDKYGWRTGKPTGTLFDDWSPENYNVFILGGSALFGYSVDDDETLPAHLEALGRQNGTPKMRVYNLGQMGYNSHDETNVLVDQLRKRRIPDVVVLYDGANEAGRGIPGRMTENVKAEYVEADYSYWDVLALFEKGQRTFNPEYLPITEFAGRVSDFIKRLGQGRVQSDSSELEVKLSQHAKKAADRYLRNMELVSKLGRGIGFKSVFILRPLGACLDDPGSYPFRYFGPPKSWQVIYYRHLYSEIVTLASHRSEVGIVNLCRALNEPVRNGFKPFNTQVHLNSDGNRFMAGIVLGLIQDVVR